jgi:hypothetical protein
MGEDAAGKKFVSLEDVYVAYRKAKADHFFERSARGLLEYVEFERDVDSHLELVHSQVLDGTIWDSVNLFDEQKKDRESGD